MKKNVTVEAREMFRKELRDLLNKYNLDEECNTPDHILADLLLSAYDGYALHVTRRDEAVGFLDSEEDEDEQPESKRGYIVIKDGKRPLIHTVFVEWRNRRPVYSNCADNAMVFVHRPVAEHIAEKLGEGWYVLDLDELWRESDKARALLDAIFRDDDEDDEEE